MGIGCSCIDVKEEENKKKNEVIIKSNQKSMKSNEKQKKNENINEKKKEKEIKEINEKKGKKENNSNLKDKNINNNNILNLNGNKKSLENNKDNLDEQILNTILSNEINVDENEIKQKLDQTDVKFEEENIKKEEDLNKLNENNKQIEEEKKEINKLNIHKKHFEEIIMKYNNIYKNLLEKLNHDNFMANHLILMENVNLDIDEINNNLNISINDLKLKEDILTSINEQNIIYDNLKSNIKTISNKSSTLMDIYDNFVEKIKKKENCIKNIKKQLYEIEIIEKSENILNILIEKNGIISDKLNELEIIIKDIENDIKSYNKCKEDINKDMMNIQEQINNYKNNIENLINKIIEESENNIKNVDEKFIKSSMLIFSKENPKDIYQSKLLFNEKLKEGKSYKPILLYKNWNEKCYIYNDYDIHEIDFELKAVGLPGRICINNCSIGVNIDSSIDILELEIDGKETESEYKNNTIRFEINLGNEQSNLIHLKYKETPLFTNLNEGEKKERNFYRYKYYGIKKYVQNQKAKFKLFNQSDFEIINFDDDFLIKENENEYTWGGIVPIDGKRTIVRMSKPKGKFIFEIIIKIENIEKKPIISEKLISPFYLEGGNNIITNIVSSSKQTDQIIKNEKIKKYEVNFVNIKESIGIFTIKCELMNRCKGEWKCDLTDDEIESGIPKDFKENKNIFKKMANKIIKEYKDENKNDLIEVTDMVIIGKWVKNNIEYDINYLKRFEITAIETLENKIGSHYHITQLYNALMFSLGYKCIYVSGFISNKSNIYNENNYHSWSLIKVNDKWLPFDPTFGIFTGKLPITHVFNSYFKETVNKEGSDIVKIREVEIHGKILD